MMNLMEGTPQALDRAIHLLEQATARDPNYAAAWAALGAAYDFKGQFQSLPHLSLKAVEMGRRAIEIDPTLADAHRWLGLSLMSIARYDDAIAAIQEAARLEPDDANVYSSLGRAGTGSARETSTRGSPIWNVPPRSIQTSAMRISSSGSCMPFEATTPQRRRPADAPSTFRNVSSQGGRGCRSSVPIHVSGMSNTFGVNIGMRCASSNSRWKHSQAPTMR